MANDPAIERLKKRILSNREERAAYQRVYDLMQDRVREIVTAKHKWPEQFWCNTCKADFTARGHKVVRKLPRSLPIAWHVAYCPARHKCIKRITEKPNDPYYLLSYAIRRDRARYRDEMLTPDDPRFWMLYGHKHGFDGFRAIDKPPTPQDLNDERNK